MFDDLFSSFSNSGSKEIYNITDDLTMSVPQSSNDTWNCTKADTLKLLDEYDSMSIGSATKFANSYVGGNFDSKLGGLITGGDWAGTKGNIAQDGLEQRLQEERLAQVNGEVFKLKISSLVNTSEVITLHVSPEITDTHQAQYEQLNMIHSPFSFQVYKYSTSRTFEIHGHLVSRNSLEASKNMKYLTILRSWTKPYFGAGTAYSSFKNLLGAPPDILSLSAYGPKHIYKVPVVLSSVSIPYPTDVDYIPTCEGEPFPRLMTISMTLLETYSPDQVSKFNMQAYKAGRLGIEFNKPKPQPAGGGTSLKTPASKIGSSVASKAKNSAKKSISQVMKNKGCELNICKF